MKKTVRVVGLIVIIALALLTLTFTFALLMVTLPSASSLARYSEFPLKVTLICGQFFNG